MISSDAFVNWLFDRLVLDEALAGDLREERARGRSTTWYWRQVVIAVWIGVQRPIFQHKLLTLRALGTGCAVNGVWLFLWLQFLPIGLPVRPEISFNSVAGLATILLTQVATGWVIARTHRPYSISMVFAFVVWLAFWHLAGGSEVKTLAMHSFGRPEFPGRLVWFLAPEASVVAGLLLGSLAGASVPKGDRSVHEVNGTDGLC